MVRFQNPIDLVKNIVSPPKPQRVTRVVQPKTAPQEARDEVDAAAEARRKAQAEAQKRQGRARTLLAGSSGGSTSGLQTSRTTLLGG